MEPHVGGGEDDWPHWDVGPHQVQPGSHDHGDPKKPKLGKSAKSKKKLRRGKKKGKKPNRLKNKQQSKKNGLKKKL